jgi:low temperature requirement protein LtrA
MVFWTVPQPIKAWGTETHEEAAHARWMDLFFDLLYVGVAFLVGHRLEHNFHHHGPTHSIWLSFQFFFILIGPWFSNLAFYSRFDVNDTVHKLIDVAEYVLVGCASVFMASPRSATFWWAIVGLRILTCLRYLELSLCSAHENCKSMARYLCGAEIVAIAISCVNDSGFDQPKDLTTSLVVAQVFQYGHVFVRVWLGSFSRANSVPLHIGFVTHRVGELMMLMLGESVLSLVVTKIPTASETNTAEMSMPAGITMFHAALVAGFFTSVSCMWLQYSSSTFHAHEHVLRRSGRGGVLWMNVVWLRAFVLIVVGVALRMMLTVGGNVPSIELSFLLCVALALNFILAQVNEYLHTLNPVDKLNVPAWDAYRYVVVVMEICSVVLLLCLPRWLGDGDDGGGVTGYEMVLWCGGIVCFQALLELYDPNSHQMDGRFHEHHGDHGSSQENHGGVPADGKKNY